MVRTIERSTVLDTVERVAGHVVLQAGAGYGKSVLLDQIRARLERTNQIVEFVPVPGEAPDRFDLRLRTAYEQAGAFDLAARLLDDGVRASTIERDHAAVLLIDDVDLFDDISAKRMVDHLRGARGAVRLVAAGRSLPTSLQRLELGHPVVQLGHEALAVSIDEARTLLAERLDRRDASHDLVRAVIDRSAGCFAVVHALIQRAAGYDDPLVALARVLEHNSVLPALVDECAADLSADDRQVLATLASLPAFTAAMVIDLGGPGTLDRLIAAGFPFWDGDAGWLALPRPLAELLHDLAPVDLRRLRVAARTMASAGRVRQAVDLLLRAGDDDTAAELLDDNGGMSPRDVTPVDVLTATDRMADVVARHPRLLLLRANAFWALTMFDDCRAELLRAETLARAARDGAVARRAAAEQVLLDVLDGPRTDTRARLDVLAGELGPDETITLARISEARGAIDAWPQTASGFVPAEFHYRRAIALWTQLRDPTQLARAVRGLVVAVLLPSGRYDEAQRELRESIAIAGRTNVVAHTAALVLLGQVAAANADAAAAEPALDEARLLGRASGLAWVEAYAAWARMNLAALRRDAALVRRYHDEATSLLGTLATQATGAILLEEAVVAAVRAGDIGYAAEQLDVLLGLPGTAGDRELARLCVLAHGGDAAEALELAESLALRQRVPAARRWHTTLLHALALARCGELERAEEAYRMAMQRAADWGVAHLPPRLEHATCAAIERLVAGDDRVTFLEPANVSFAVQALGSFVVWRNGRVLPMAPSNATDLVKLVACHGGKVSVDLVCDALWPESTSDAGRRRLKNVMLRARVATAGLVERHDQSVVFRAGTELDVALFERRARDAQTSVRDDPGRARKLARSALEIAGVLLPDDLYTEWSGDPRLQLRRRVASLVDIVLGESVDTASAAWLAELVTSSDPYDDGRLLRIAGLLSDNGGEALAATLIAQVADIYGDVDHLGA